MTSTMQDTGPTTDQLNSTYAEAAEAIAALTQVQAAYDVDGFRIAPPRKPLYYKLRHMNYHTRKAVGKIDGMVEHWEHRELDGAPGGTPTDDEVSQDAKDAGLVAAELLMTALQLAEIGGFNLAEAHRDLLARNAKHFIPDSGFAGMEQTDYTESFGGPAKV